MVVLLMVVLVLLQRSEGGALGIGGGGGLSARGSGNVLTRTTAILVAVFFSTSLGMAILTRQIEQSTDILDAATSIESSTTTEQDVEDTEDAGDTDQPSVLDALREQSGLEDPEVPDTQ